ELERHHVDLFGKLPHCAEVEIFRAHLEIRDLARGRVRVRRERVHPIPHATRADREHAPELSAAQNPDRRPRQDRLHSASPRTRSRGPARAAVRPLSAPGAPRRSPPRPPPPPRPPAPLPPPAPPAPPPPPPAPPARPPRPARPRPGPPGPAPRGARAHASRSL